MTTKPNTPTLAEAQDALAAMEVVCPTIWRHPIGEPNVLYQEGTELAYPTRPISDRHPEVCACQGTGTLPWFPALRVACRGGRWNSSNAWPCNNGKLQWNPGYKGKIIEVNHEACQGRGWVPNRDWAAVRQAAEDAGWWFEIDTNPDYDGNWVWLFERDNDEPIGVVKGEGLRNQHAETVVLWRAAVGTQDAAQQPDAGGSGQDA